jgi:hypothetical protein
MDGELAFPTADTSHRLVGGFLNVVFGKVSHQKEAGRVGMTAHGHVPIFAGQDVKCCVFYRVISSRFK